MLTAIVVKKMKPIFSLKIPSKVQFFKEDEKVELYFLYLLLSLFLIGILIWSLSALFPQDTGWIPDEVKSKILPKLLHLVKPEPTERRIYILSTVLSPLIISLSILLIEKNLRIYLKILAPFCQCLFSLFIVLLFLRFLNFPIVTEVLGFSFNDSVFKLINLALGVGISLFLIQPSMTTQTLLKQASFFLAAVLLIIIGSIWRVFSIGSITMEGPFVDHFNAALYAQSQAATGKIVLYDFPSQYGYYVEFLAPWFKWIGLSVLTFTSTMSALQALSIASILFFLSRHIKNFILFCFCGAVLVLIISVWFNILHPFEPYFQYWPIRLLCPALAIILFDLWQQKKSRVFTIGVSFFCGFSLLWNLDSGVAVAGSWLALQIFEFFILDRKKALLQLLISIAGIALVILFFQLNIYLTSGHWINWNEITRSQWIFYYAGFNMLPIPTQFHPWMLLICIYIAGLVLGIGWLKGKLIDRRFYLIFFISILGIGLFSYYQGRSHDYCLTSVTWPAILILFLLGQKALDLLKEQRLGRMPGFLFLTILASSGTLSIERIWKGLPILISLTQDHFYRLNFPKSSIAENAKFISSSLNGKKECAIFSPHQAVYFAENQLASSITGPGLNELLLKSDVQSIHDQITQSPPEDLFLEPSYWVESQSNEKGIQLSQLVLAKYTLVATSQSGELLYFRRN